MARDHLSLAEDPGLQRSEAPVAPMLAADAAAGVYRAGMLYIAADLQRVARFAPAAQAQQVLALSRLIAALGRSQDTQPAAAD